MDATTLKALVDLRDRTLQKSRIAFGNRIGAIERGEDNADEEAARLLKRWFNRFDDLEQELDEDIRDMMDGVEIVERMCAVKGIGKILAAKTVSMIDIEKAATVSALWRYAGFAVIEGKGERREKGKTLHFNMRLKATCFIVAGSMMRANSPYRQIYDNAREHYEVSHPEWTKLHRHNAARRKMIKVWLSHLWEVWRQIEGLPVRNIYAQDQLGHEHYISPQDYGWESVS